MSIHFEYVSYIYITCVRKYACCHNRNNSKELQYETNLRTHDY